LNGQAKGYILGEEAKDGFTGGSAKKFAHSGRILGDVTQT
jgi:hypothetical protein